MSMLNKQEKFFQVSTMPVQCTEHVCYRHYMSKHGTNIGAILMLLLKSQIADLLVSSLDSIWL